MDSHLKDKIRRSRMILQNPYAHIGADGEYDVVVPVEMLNVHDARRALKNQYAFLDQDGGFSEYPYHDDRAAAKSRVIDIDKINTKKIAGGRYSREEIEGVARKLQREMWSIRKELFPAREEVSALEVLNPSLAFESLGYEVGISDSLGQCSVSGELFEVAGILDNANSQVRISRRFSSVIRNFTMAHELGHAVLHDESGLHRDRALDGAPCGRVRVPKEFEADVFAAYFLLPERQVRVAFEEIFLTQVFCLNEDTAFALTSGDMESLKNRCRTLRDLTRIVARAGRYNGVHVVSLADKFKVSVEAMAIRLEELRLVEM